VRPGLDDKILTSWNALTISGLISCYKAFGNLEYLELALANANFLKQKVLNGDGRLLHSYKNNQAKITGFLEDYAFVIEAFTALFEATGQKEWFDIAQQLTAITFQEFYDKEKSIFYFTASQQKDLITRTIEIHDNVIPSSNSVMAKNLFRLSYLLERPDYLKIAQEMLNLVTGSMAIVGEKAISLLNELQRNYLPHVIFCAGITENNLPILRSRFVSGKTLIYICQNNSCQLPVETVEEALILLQKKD